MAASSTTNSKEILKKLIEPGFLHEIMATFDEVFDSMNGIDKFIFSKYDKLVADVQSFKNSLLKFVLDARTHFSLLKDNMASNRFQQWNEEQQLKFIEKRLNQVNDDTILEYIGACTRLIETSIALYDEYDKTSFKLKFMLYNILGCTVFGAAAGLTIALFLPFFTVVEVGIGAVGGVIAGLIFAVYQLFYKWDERMQQIQVVRDSLKVIHNHLVDVENALRTTYKEVNVR
jgi:hypothetical protein